ncbi:MAG: tetratricopeptide repeat protein [Verrucomicrobia bacterium]|nr:tetratricopeptide repeat protein [Verrucomicrobiota bacterium]
MLSRLPTFLIAGLCCALATGCFGPKIRFTKLGPDRILTDVEVEKVRDMITAADQCWLERATPGQAGKSLDTLRDALKLAPYNVQALWRAARACAWLAERAGDAKDKPQQAKLADEGIGYAHRATFVDSDRKEGYYYLAISYAMRADATPSNGLALVPLIVKALKKADEPVGGGLDHSGPDRVLGQIYLNAPPWPASVGDVEEAIDKLENACDQNPEFPENHLVLAEAYIKARKYRDVRKHLERVLNAQPAPDWAAELPRLKERAEKLLQKLPQK